MYSFFFLQEGRQKLSSNSMGAFRVLIYGIMASVFTYSLIYDFLYVPRLGHVWWIYKLFALTYINLVRLILFFHFNHLALMFSAQNFFFYLLYIHLIFFLDLIKIIGKNFFHGGVVKFGFIKNW